MYDVNSTLYEIGKYEIFNDYRRQEVVGLEDIIREQSIFEDSALEDASAYARLVNNGAKRFQRKEFSIFKAVEDGMKLSIQQSTGKLNDTGS